MRRHRTDASRGPARVNSGRSPTGAPGRPANRAKTSTECRRWKTTRCVTSPNGQVVALLRPSRLQRRLLPGNGRRACLGPSDCWFGGEPLQEPQIGAFQLHWNGSSLEAEPYTQEGHAIEDMRLFDGHIYESVTLRPSDRSARQERNPEPPVVHRIEPEGVLPPFEAESLPLLRTSCSPTLDFLRLSAAGEEALWGAAGPPAAAEASSAVTVVLRPQPRATGARSSDPRAGRWAKASSPKKLPSSREGAEHATVSAIAAEPQQRKRVAGARRSKIDRRQSRSRGARTRLGEGQRARSRRRCRPRGEQGEGIARKGAAAKLACPAPQRLLAGDHAGLAVPPGPRRRTHAAGNDPGNGILQGLITFRPPDQGLPQVPPDAPPPDTSGLVEEAPNYGGTFAEAPAPSPAALAKVALPLLSRLHSRLVHGDDARAQLPPRRQGARAPCRQAPEQGRGLAPPTARSRRATASCCCG